LDQACALLAHSEDTRIIAGGQTLVPLMAMRLARPKRLIDIARIFDLAFVRHELDAIAIGATTRQCVIERDALVRAQVSLLAKVMPFIGHPAIRARGTIGGSLANADPAAGIPLVAVTLGATMLYREGTANAEIAAADFFLGPMMTALPATACLTVVRFPLWGGARIGVGFHEISARRLRLCRSCGANQGRCGRRLPASRARHRRSGGLPLRLDMPEGARGDARRGEPGARKEPAKIVTALGLKPDDVASITGWLAQKLFHIG
jgi:carbon-monoxide dehydrogenase medium subunit